MAVAQGVDTLAFKPTLSGLDEQRLAASRLRERPLGATQAPISSQSSSLSLGDQLRQARKLNARENTSLPELKSGTSAMPKEKFGSSFAGIKSTIGNLRGQAKQAKASAVDKLKGAAEEAVSAPISAATSEFLKQSWLNIIDSWGLTLLYINFHVVCRFVFGEKLFCKLGHEWLEGKGGGKGGAKSAGAMSGILGLPLDAVGIGEAALLGLLDLLVILIILIALTPYILMAWIMISPSDAIFSNLGAFYEFVKAGVGL
jgi:hypothetical protein